MTRRVFVFLLLFGIMLPDVSANMGLPMLGLAWPVFWIGLLPITLIEWLVMQKEIKYQPTNRLGLEIFYANFLSTLFGIPITWFVMLVIQICIPGGGGTFPELSGTIWPYVLGVTVQAAWLIPYGSQFYWMVPVAFIVLLIPFFFASYWIEGNFIAARLGKGFESKQALRKAAFKANMFSYGMLLLVAIFTLIYQIINK